MTLAKKRLNAVLEGDDVPPPVQHRPPAALLTELSSAVLTPAELRLLVEITQDKISADLDRRVAVKKASRDYASIPIQEAKWELMRHGCPCKCAAAWDINE
jgi:hypothetical protein